MDRRPLVALLALGLFAAAPAGAMAASADALLAQSGGGTLSDASGSAEDLIAQTTEGTLSDTPTTKGGAKTSGSGSGSKTTATASPASLPFTGSDPRVMLALGVAALLAGAGLRLRTGDARDF